MSHITVTPDKLRNITKTCTNQVRAIENVERAIRTSITTSGWRSPAAEKFTRDWDTHYVKALNEIQKALESLGQAATKMAQNYDDTEAAYKGVA